MLGIDWIDDIEIQVFCINFLAELKAFRAELIQSQPHPTTHWYYPRMGGNKERKKKRKRHIYTPA